MALPKRKLSKSKSKKRRTHYKLSKPGLSLCSNCGELRPPHRACPSCGFYKGRILFKHAEEPTPEEIES